MKKWLSILLSLAIISTMLWMPVFAAEENAWHTGWSKHNATVLEDGNTVSMVAASGATASISTSISKPPANLGEQFDITVIMSVPQFCGNEHIVIGTGKSRKATLYVKENSFAGFPYAVRNSEHTYRMIGKNDIVEIFVDGTFLGFYLLEAEGASEKARIYFQVTNHTAAEEEIVGEMLVRDITFLSYTGSQVTEEDVDPAKRSMFCDFNDDTIGNTSNPSSIGPDGIKNPRVVWSDDFFDNDISDWTNKNFEVVDVDGNKMLHTSTAGAFITYSNNKVLQLKDKNFSLRFKTKLAIPKGGTGYSNISANFGNYATEGTQNLGWSSLSMTPGFWYEWMYLYSYDPEGTGRVDGNDNAVTGNQEVKIYSRGLSASGSWGSWVLRNALPVTKYQGTATSLKLSFPDAANQQATDVWFDDFQVYLHEEVLDIGGDHTGGWISSDGSWFLKDGTYRVENTNSTEGYYATTNLHPVVFPGENFRIEMRTKIAALSHQQVFSVSWPGYQFTLRPRSTYFEYVASQNTVTEYVGNLLDDSYHDIVIETYNSGSMVKLFVDGVLLVNEPAKKSTGTTGAVSWSVASQGGKLSSIIMDSFSFTIVQEKLAVETIQPDGVYTLGSEIAVSAKTVYLDEEPDIVEYRIGNEVVATGTAPDYSANIPNLGVGNYEIVATARNGMIKSGGVRFSVVQENGTLTASLRGDTLTASLSGMSGYTKEYLLDGQVIGRGDSVTMSGISLGRHTLLVICRDETGAVVQTFTQTLKTDNNDGTSAGYANDITYSVLEDATVDFSNGNHRLYLKHSAAGLTYLTDEGEKIYPNGFGDMEVITDGPVADIYRNGQLIFSYLMPMDDTVKTTATGVEGFAVSMPEKNQYFLKRNVSGEGKVYPLGKLPYNHNLDVVADETDEAHLVLNDGYYQSDILFQSGKIYVLTGTLKDAKTKPVYTYLADMVQGRTFYRMETAYGICRIYGNGRFLTSYQAVPGGGNGSLYLDVQRGSLDYVGVNDNRDLRVFKDSFDNTGEFSSDRFWQTAHMIVALEGGSVSLLPEEGTAGLLEWNAFATDFDLTTNLNVTSCNGGFWFILGHSVEEVYTKVGYNAVSKKYEIVEVNGSLETILAEKSAGWFSPVGTDLSVTLSAKRTGKTKTVTFSVKGGYFIDVTLSTESASHQTGTFGLMLKDATATLYDVNYRGDAMLVNGLVNNSYDVDSGINKTADLVVVDEDTMFFMQKQSTARDYSYDGGRTWQKSNVSRVGDNYNAVRLRSGKLLGTLLEGMGNGKKAYTVYLSPNNGEFWERLGIMQEPEPTFYAGQNRMMETDYGRVFFITGVGKGDESSGDVHRVFYSDNEGTTWVESENCIDPEQIGMVVDEAVLVQVSDTVMRCYFRTDSGFIRYIESSDKGETWNNKKVYSTPFASAANCFNVERDPETGMLYLAWGYDNVNLCGMIQLPRTRWAVAMSRDNGTTWEYVGTGHEDNERAGSTMMNLSINVARQNLILSGYSSDSGLTVNQGVRRIAISKDQVPSLRFDQLHVCEEDLIGTHLNLYDVQNALVLPAETSRTRGANVLPDGVTYQPEEVWRDNFTDGDMTGWTEKTAGFEVVNTNGNFMLHASATETEGGAEIQVQNRELDMDGKDFTFRFKQKMSGGDRGFGNLAVAFGTNTTEKSHNVGYGNAGLGMEMDTWYEWAYVYRYDAVEGIHYLNIYDRHQDAYNRWSEWQERAADIPVALAQTTERQNRFVLTFNKVGGNQLATDIWYDDFSLYLHQPAFGSGLLNGYQVENISDGRLVLVDAAATLLGAMVTQNANGDVLFTRGKAVVTFPEESITLRNGKQFVDIDLLCESYQLTVKEWDGVQIVSEQADWTDRQQSVLSSLLRNGGVDAATISSGGLMHCYVDEIFSELTAPNYTTIGNTKAEDSMLSLEPKDSFAAEDLVIPEGGYGDLRIKGKGMVLILCDGVNLLEVSDFAQEEWTDCRILRGKDGEYSVYTKKADETNWQLRIAQTESALDGQDIRICLSNQGTGEVVVDFLKVYGPATNQPVVVIDGATSNMIQNGETSIYGGNVRVLLNLTETEITKAKGIIVGYNAAGVMVAMEEFDVFPGDGEVAYNTKQMGSSDIKTMKVFVWSDYVDGTPIIPTFVARRK